MAHNPNVKDFCLPVQLPPEIWSDIASYISVGECSSFIKSRGRSCPNYIRTRGTSLSELQALGLDPSLAHCPSLSDSKGGHCACCRISDPNYCLDFGELAASAKKGCAQGPITGWLFEGCQSDRVDSVMNCKQLGLKSAPFISTFINTVPASTSDSFIMTGWDAKLPTETGVEGSHIIVGNLKDDDCMKGDLVISLADALIPLNGRTAQGSATVVNLARFFALQRNEAGGSLCSHEDAAQKIRSSVTEYIKPNFCWDWRTWVRENGDGEGRITDKYSAVTHYVENYLTFQTQEEFDGYALAGELSKAQQAASN